MSLIPRHQFDFDSLFDSFFSPVNYQPTDNFFSPRVDIREYNDRYCISVDLPGVKKDDIKISVQRGVLNVEASLDEDIKEEEEGRIIRQERRSGTFQRSFTVGDSIKEDEISAHFENGVLKVNAPKREAQNASERRCIEIQ
jgi:HSP20 family protein